MRVWVDLTNSPHVLVMRPLIERMRAAGHDVQVTARDFAQTLQLLDRFRMDHTALGHHRGGKLADKGVGLVQRSLALTRWARNRRFDVAMGHGSNDVTVAAKLLGIPSATAFDYEWATVQHSINCRLARRVVVPDAIPPRRLAGYGATADKLRPYAGLKEEYYLADFEPDRAVLDELGLDPSRPLAVVRTDDPDALQARLDSAGVGARGYYRTPVHLQPAMAGLGGDQLELPGTMDAARTHLALPMGTQLARDQIDAVVAACASGLT